METTEKKPKRQYPPVKVYCLPEERAILTEQAHSSGLSLSAFLLTVGMGYPIKSMVDIHKANELVRINGDLGRLGGLLKLWLTDSSKTALLGADEIRQVLSRIEENQKAIDAVLKEVLIPKAKQ